MSRCFKALPLSVLNKELLTYLLAYTDDVGLTTLNHHAYEIRDKPCLVISIMQHTYNRTIAKYETRSIIGNVKQVQR